MIAEVREIRASTRRCTMKKNMGTVDRVIRLVIVVGIGVLFATGQLSGTLAIVLGIVAVAFLVTSLVGWCPVYTPFGLSTKCEHCGKGGEGSGKSEGSESA